MTPILTASKLYEENGGDFAQSLKEHLGVGCVVSTPTSFLMGYFTKRGNPKQSVPYDESDCVFVTLHTGNMVQSLAQLRDLVGYIAFDRSFRGDDKLRVYNIKKFNRAIKWVV